MYTWLTRRTSRRVADALYAVWYALLMLLVLFYFDGSNTQGFRYLSL